MNRYRSNREDEASKSGGQMRRFRHMKKRGRSLGEFVGILLLAIVLVFGFIRPFVVKSFWIPSESMVPTLEVGDRLFVNRFIYRFTEPKRGDIVVFSSMEGVDDLIKRVVGVPGDRVSFRKGMLKVNGKVQDEPYINKEHPDRGIYKPVRVPEGEVFVMGDNRANSRDSRFFGPAPIENIEGEAFFMFWPPSRIGPI